MKKSVKKIKGKKVTITDKPDIKMSDDLLPEYDVTHAKQYRKKNSKNRVVVELEPDVAEFFQTSLQVNETLKAIIKSIRKTRLVNP